MDEAEVCVMKTLSRTGEHPASIVELRAVLSRELSPRRLRVKRTFDGTIDLRILADAFEDVESPIDIVHEKLASAGLTLPERVLTFLKAPAEVDEEEERLLFAPEAIGTPTWGDALLLEPAQPTPGDDRDFRCRVVAFWGLKGGVGRSTALAHVASILGRRLNVLAIDLDLDSPGLVATLADDVVTTDDTRFENLVRKAAEKSKEDDLDDAVRRALRRGKDPHARVDVLGPSHADAGFVQALLGPLAPSALYRGGQPALRRLIRSAIRGSEAEIVLVDARSGYCDESAMTVLDLADGVVLFASPAPTTFVSIEPAIHALERNRRAIGRPRLVHIVAGMMPSGEEARKRILNELGAVLEQARERVSHELGTSEGTSLPADLDILPVDYASRIVENEGRILPGAAEGYRELAERLSPIAAIAPVGLPEPSWVREVLRQAQIPGAQAEHEQFEKLAELFTSTRNLHDFVRHEVCLVLGAKGTGKSYLRRMCQEEKDILIRRSGTKSLENTIFVDGYSQPHQGGMAKPPITRDVLRALDDPKGPTWSHLWSALALGRAIVKMSDSGIEVASLLGDKRRGALAKLAAATSATEVCAATKKLAEEPLGLDDSWEQIDGICGRAGKTLTLLFDDLDVALGESMKEVRRRRQMIEGLLDRTNVSWVSRRHLSAKVFLREDIFRALEVEEEAKYATRRVVLQWNPEEIWRLIIRAFAVASNRFAKHLSTMGVDIDRLEESSEEQRNAALTLIWGERMGEGESNTRVKAWVWGRLHDGRNRMFPRAALWLLRFAVEERRKRIDDKFPLLDPQALRAAVPSVATERLVELEKECTPIEKKRLALLRGFDSYQDERKFLSSLKTAGEAEPRQALEMFDSIGVTERGSRRDGKPTVRIVDLYAFAPKLDINRLGRK
jgi:cellulose biosynthesis protein BcsQ